MTAILPEGVFMTYAEIFSKKLNEKFGNNFRHVALRNSDLVGEGNPRALGWNSFGEIEVVTFDDGSTYEPAEQNFCKPSH